MTPCLLCSTALSIELLLGALKMPMPALCNTIPAIASGREDDGLSAANISKPALPRFSQTCCKTAALFNILVNRKRSRARRAG